MASHGSPISPRSAARPAAQAGREWTADWVRRFDVYDSLAWRADVTGRPAVRLARALRSSAAASARAAPGARRSPSRARRAISRASPRARATGLARLRAAARPGRRGGGAGRPAAAAPRAEPARARGRRARSCRDGGHRGRGPLAQLDGAALPRRCARGAGGGRRGGAGCVPGRGDRAGRADAALLPPWRRRAGAVQRRRRGRSGGDRSASWRAPAPRAARRSPRPRPASSGCRPAARWCCSIAARPRRAGYGDEPMPARCRFEMSHGRERIIVNCGAYRGPGAEWRTAHCAPPPPIRR